MRIQHNIMAMSAYRNYTNNVSAMKKNLEKLSSGYKINRAGDDAAGLAISEKMRAQITGLETAQKNAKDGISLVQTAEGALTEVHDMLNRMVELATQSANGTYDNTTDRFQMQKEVDQLLSEIDRISKSSNFNGINLLDGSLGLNKDAFSFSSVAAQEVNDGTISISSLVAKEADGSPKVHLEEASVSAATPAAVIDLGDLSVKVAGKGTATKASATITFTIGGKDVAVTLTNTNAAASTKNATAIATALATALQKDTDFGVKKSNGVASAAGDAIRLGDGVFTISAANATITLTYAGRGSGAAYASETSFTGDKAMADSINGSLGFDVVVKEKSGAVEELTGDVIHKATGVTHAQAKEPASLAGIDIKLTEDLIVEGGTLKIDGKTFTFKTDADSTLTGAGVIDVSTYKTKQEMIHAAADLLSQETEFNGQDSRKWKIGVNGDGTTIHIDQTNASSSSKELDTYNKLVGLVEAKGKAVVAGDNATKAGTKITINDSEVKEGNVLTIDGKKYVFADKESTVIPEGATKVAIKGGAAKNLAAALSVTAPDYNESDGTIIVRAAKAGDAAPVVLGKGLTLQIGDTSDSFNQLNVAVQNMNSESIGIGKLDISTEDAAQAATDKIKAAINVVSDVRGTLGATQNRLEHTINNLSVMTENIQDAESTIRDTDVAEEMMAYTKNNILIQSAQAMLAQANQVPQGVLQLLG